VFKYQFACSDEWEIRSNIEQMILNDLPCGKSFFGGDLYRRGIHFQRCDEVIQGFYLATSENEAHRGSPSRIRFRGRFVRDKDDCLFFEVYIYPRILEVLFLVFAFLSFSYNDKVMGSAVSAFVLPFIIYGYYKSIKDTCDVFKRIFR